MGKGKAAKAVTGKAHSKIGASSMYRWVECPGSVKLCEGVPTSESSYAHEGTQAHELAEAILRIELFKEHGWAIPNRPQEMQDAVRVYTNFVLEESKNASEVLIEHRFSLTEIHPALFGTADCVIYDALKKKLTVVDYKHGAGISVSPRNNLQLMYYGLGALMSLGYPCDAVELVIVQPRCPHTDGAIRKYGMLAIELFDFAATLDEAAKATDDPNAPLKAGDHCRFCPAAALCPELAKRANLTATKEFSALTGYDPQELADTLTKLDMIEDWARSVRVFAYNEAVQGRCPPGWKLVQKQARRKWRDEEEVIKALISEGATRQELFDEPKLLSPNQIENAFGKKVLEIINPLIVQVSSGTTLVPESDKRGNIIRDAAEDFGALE